MLYKVLKNSDLNRRNSQQLTKKRALVALVCQGNILFCHKFLQHSTSSRRILKFSTFNPFVVSIFMYHSNFQHVIGKLISSLESSQGTFYTLIAY
jgi:hypothetical protein